MSLKAKGLDQACKIFDVLASELCRTRRIEDKINVINLITDWCVKVHCGRFTSEIVEKEIALIGEGLKDEVQTNYSKFKNTILHVGTQFYDIGGHTRLFEKYVTNLTVYQHDLVQTEQNFESLPLRIKKLIEKKEIGLKTIDHEANQIERARQLAQLSSQYEYVFFHIHPGDIVPIIANSIIPFNKAIFINHADHVYWVGSSIVNICINIRPFAKNLSEERRGISRNLVLPIPVSVIKKSDIEKNNARKRLGIASDKIVFLCISSTYKIIPNENHFFMKTVENLLKRNAKYEFYLIGVPNESWKQIGYVRTNSRIHIIPPTENILDYQLSADFYLEGFPYNSLTALLESISVGCFPILMYSPQSPNARMDTELAFEGLLYHPKTEEEYIEQICFYAENEMERSKLLENLLTNLALYNGGAYWHQTFKKINDDYGQSIKNFHQEFQISDNDIELNKFNLNKYEGVTGNLLELTLGIENISRISLANKIRLLSLSYPYQRGRHKLLRFAFFLIKTFFHYNVSNPPLHLQRLKVPQRAA